MLNNSIVDGRIIVVNLATPRSNRVEQLQTKLQRAEFRLAKARVEFKRIREEMSLNSSEEGKSV